MNLITKTLRDGRTVSVARHAAHQPLVATASDGTVIVTGYIQRLAGKPVPYAIVSDDRKAALGLTSSEHAELIEAMDRQSNEQALTNVAALPEIERLRIERDRLQYEIDRAQDNDYRRVLALRREQDAVIAKIHGIKTA